MRQLTTAGMGAVGIVAGKVASRALPSLVGLNQVGFAGVAIQAVSAFAAGWAAGKFINPEFGKMVLAGGLAGIIEGYIKAANIPVVSATLGDEFSPVGMYELPTMDNAALGLYSGMSDGSGEGEDITDSVGLVAG